MGPNRSGGRQRVKSAEVRAVSVYKTELGGTAEAVPPRSRLNASGSDDQQVVDEVNAVVTFARVGLEIVEIEVLR